MQLFGVDYSTVTSRLKLIGQSAVLSIPFISDYHTLVMSDFFEECIVIHI